MTGVADPEWIRDTRELSGHPAASRVNQPASRSVGRCAARARVESIAKRSVDRDGIHHGDEVHLRGRSYDDGPLIALGAVTQPSATVMLPLAAVTRALTNRTNTWPTWLNKWLGQANNWSVHNSPTKQVDESV